MANFKTSPWKVLAASAVAVSHTGNANETVLATITIPANAMGANGRIRVTALWSYTNSANNKICRVRFGGISGTLYSEQTLTTTVHFRDQREIANRNATNSQVGASRLLGSGGWAASNVGVATSSVDTTAAVDLVLTGQLANAGETIRLESYLVELIRP